jgi:hypothetical protein
MKIAPPFYIREEYTPEILALLTKTSLGTNGAKYQLLDTKTRIQELDNPLFLSVERNQKAIGNITFCKRDKNWYIRYFAFDSLFQKKDANQFKNNTQSRFKQEILAFFNQLCEQDQVRFYAYIDPLNQRSLEMSKTFGFKAIGKITTQTYSRFYPSKKLKISISEDEIFNQQQLDSRFNKHSFYFSNQSKKAPFYVSYNEKNEIIAFAKITRVHWKIERLPGKLGKLQSSILPYIPWMKKIIYPPSHHFLAIDSVWIQEDNPQLLSDFFESILAEEKQHLLFWWVDEREQLFTHSKNQISWGIFHKILKNPSVHVVQKTNTETIENSTAPFYISAFDLV